MKLKNSFRLIALLMFGACLTTACSDDDDDDNETPNEEKVVVKNKSFFVLNEGVMGQNNATITFVDQDSNKTVKDLFSETNGRKLGDTGQDLIIYGSKIYACVNGSNIIEVLDRKTLKSIAQIKPEKGQGSPRNVVSNGGKVYVSMYDGYVAKIDTASLKIEESVKVGPNPEELVITNGYLYVANSDGLGWETNYENGKSVSKIDLKSFKETKKIAVGLNPTSLKADEDGNLFVVCTGNYGDIPSSIQKIMANDSVIDLNIYATIIAVNGSTLYTVNAPWGASEIDYRSYSTKSGKLLKEKFVNDANVTQAPHAINIDSENGDVYISAYAAAGDYQSEGIVYQYHADTLKAKYNVGIGPRKVIFNR